MAIDVVEKGISVRKVEKFASLKRDESKKTNKKRGTYLKNLNKNCKNNSKERL